MAIQPIGSQAAAAQGLQATGAAIQRAQERFDAKAAEVVANAQAQTTESPTSGEDQTRSVVGLEEERAVNNVLYGVFRRQQEQQKNLLDLVGGGN